MNKRKAEQKAALDAREAAMNEREATQKAALEARELAMKRREAASTAACDAKQVAIAKREATLDDRELALVEREKMLDAMLARADRSDRRHAVDNNELLATQLAARALAAAMAQVEREALEDVVTEAEGFLLHLSDKTNSGYKGVSRTDSGRFRAELTMRTGKQRKTLGLGRFDTAVEAAVAYARAAASSESSASSEPFALGEGPALCPAHLADVVLEAEGWHLHLSSKSSTGYKGVYHCKGRFKAEVRDRDQRGMHRIGLFDSAVEAAIAFARYELARAGDAP